MSKMYEGYKVMDEMVVDTIVDFAKAYFDNSNTYIDLELKTLRMLDENQIEISKIQSESIRALKDNLVEIGKVQLENLDKLNNNQIELNNKLDILIEQNERLIDLLSNNSQTQNSCPECGNPIPTDSKFCIKCGAKF